MNKQELQRKANEVRKGIVTAVHAAKAGHPGGSLSAADIFTYLYFEELNIDPKDPKKPDRDRFVLSKGHTAPGLYSALALRGYFPVEDLKTLRHLGSYLQGHPDMKHIPASPLCPVFNRLCQFYDACRGNKNNCAGNCQHNLSGDGMHERIVPGLVQEI